MDGLAETRVEHDLVGSSEASFLDRLRDVRASFLTAHVRGTSVPATGKRVSARWVAWERLDSSGTAAIDGQLERGTRNKLHRVPEAAIIYWQPEKSPGRSAMVSPTRTAWTCLYSSTSPD